ncbi:M23 family metallopeptidase [uncultured Corynebacterium sp.]|uniref:M23 family metallopeptidase n=1 Tax=uncultured Corynebacterium sp. TaxID=159447 RepID=UPI0025F5EA3A|nr:M23 family metallopeptidase [uncultured Corynebacterium sp.]
MTETQRPTNHRKMDTSAKRRMAFAAVAVTGVTTAGAAGAGAATVQSAERDGTTVALASDARVLAQGAASTPSLESAAQILAVSQDLNYEDLTGQLASALDFNAARVAADLLSRTPATVKPTDGVYTSGFEVRWGTMHKGIDLAAPLGTPIVAAQSGTVIDAGPASGFGNWVRIKHDDGTITVYGHMQTIDVTVGQTVTAGQKIAGVGNLGFSTGPHCHFEVYPDGVNAVDPKTWLSERGVEV